MPEAGSSVKRLAKKAFTSNHPFAADTPMPVRWGQHARQERRAVVFMPARSGPELAGGCLPVRAGPKGQAPITHLQRFKVRSMSIVVPVSDN